MKQSLQQYEFRPSQSGEFSMHGNCFRVVGELVLFEGVDLEGVLARSEIKNCLIELGVLEGFLQQYELASLSVLHGLGPKYRRFLKTANGLRTLDSRCSLAGVTMANHVASLYQPTSIFTLNVLEKQIERQASEICIGSLDVATKQVFLDAPSQRVNVRKRGKLTNHSQYSDIEEFLTSFVPESVHGIKWGGGSGSSLQF